MSYQPGDFQYQDFVEPLRTEVPPLPPETWLPVYPDQIAPKAALTAAILAGAFFFVQTPPAAAALTTPTTGGQAQVFAPRVVQYQPLAHVEPPPTGVTLGWLPSYPDLVFRILPQSPPAFVQPLPPPSPPALVPPVTGHGQVQPDQVFQYQTYAYGEPPPTPTTVTTDWLPRYPDLLPTVRGLTAPYQPFVSVPHEEPVSPIDWLPRYPDRLAVRARLEGAAVEVLARIDLNWIPVYPSQFPPRVYLTADQTAAFTPTYLPIFDLRWQGTYPDRVPPLPGLLPAEQQAFAFYPTPIVQFTDLSWHPVYPDRLDPPPRQYTGATLDPFPRPTVVTYVTAVYPDRIDRPRLLLEGGGVLPPARVDVNWLPTYPDRVFPRARAVDEGFNAFVLSRVDFSWSPSYPDQVVRTVRALDPGLSVRNVQPEQTIAHAEWSGSAPAWLARPAYPAALQLPSAFNPFPYPPAGQLQAWAIYPDVIDRLSVHPSRLPYYVPGPLEPIPNPPVVGPIGKDIHLGTKESLGITSDPTIGGWQGW